MRTDSISRSTTTYRPSPRPLYLSEHHRFIKLRGSVLWENFLTMLRFRDYCWNAGPSVDRGKLSSCPWFLILRIKIAGTRSVFEFPDDVWSPGSNVCPRKWNAGDCYRQPWHVTLSPAQLVATSVWYWSYLPSPKVVQSVATPISNSFITVA